MTQEALNEKQHELLSAWIDGELTGHERAEAESLLKREDAQAWVRAVQEARSLVARHATVSAPAGIKQAVAAATARKAAVHQLPTMGWRTPAFAVAASLIVALAIMFGPQLVQPSTITTPEVARDLLEPALPHENATMLETDSEPKKGYGARDQFAELAEELRRDESGADTRADSEVGLGGAAGGGTPAERPAARAAAPEAADGAPAPEGGRLAGPAGMTQRRARGMAPPEADAVRALEFHALNPLAAQTDALWVGNLHGKATLIAENGTESVRVEVPAGGMEDLQRALRQLARDQGYERLSENRAARALDAEPGDPRAAAYLPAPRKQTDDETTATLIVRIRKLE
jgi:negative regulator of sigma E activity